MHVWRKSLMELDSAASERVAWADIAKALSIMLLVAWTLFGVQNYFNQLLILARMPLFFFVSGLFAHRVITHSSLDRFLREKVGNLVYLYVLWAVLLFLSTEVVAYFWWGAEMEPLRLLALMWAPIGDMWFLYGLAIAFVVAFLCRDLPIWLVFVGLMVIYLVTVAMGDWLDMRVFDRLARLLPYFWLGLVLRSKVWELVDKHWRLWPVFVAGYFGLSYLVLESPWSNFGPLSFVTTIIGIGALLTVSAQLSKFTWSWPLRVIGASTLYIYVTQHITMFYMDRLYGLLELRFEGSTLLTGVVVVAAGTVLGGWAARHPLFGWVFKAPWIASRRRSDSAPVNVG